MKPILYLASGSVGRKKLLTEAGIFFELAFHTADETQCDLSQPLEIVVKYLALLKMKHVTLPQGHEGRIALVLTADTLTLNHQGKLLGKPVDRNHAIVMLSDKNPTTTGTAFCLEKKEYKNGSWHTLEQIVDYDQASCLIDVPERCIDIYLTKIPYMMVSGAISVQGFGEQFVKEIHGNYSAIIGMPMFQLRQALEKMSY